MKGFEDIRGSGPRARGKGNSNTDVRQKRVYGDKSYRGLPQVGGDAVVDEVVAVVTGERRNGRGMLRRSANPEALASWVLVHTLVGGVAMVEEAADADVGAEVLAATHASDRFVSEGKCLR